LPPAFTVNDLQTPDAALISLQSDNNPGTSNKFQLAIPAQSGDRENIHRVSAPTEPGPKATNSTDSKSFLP